MDNRAFDSKRIAEGYARRPWLHREVIERIRSDCRAVDNFKNGLDVGCGAGLSTKALKLMCDKVTGTDISPEMIKVCQQLYGEEGYSFYVAKAEETRIPIEKYDVLTAAGVINWVDREKFLENVNAVMSPGGLLIVYDFGITDQCMENNNKTYTDWYQKQYLSKFPKPPRKEEFIDFMMIQSNVNARMESKEVSEKAVKDWMTDTLSDVFRGETRTMFFAGYSWFIRKKMV